MTAPDLDAIYEQLKEAVSGDPAATMSFKAAEHFGCATGALQQASELLGEVSEDGEDVDVVTDAALMLARLASAHALTSIAGSLAIIANDMLNRDRPDDAVRT